jgi:hypothetical protein
MAHKKISTPENPNLEVALTAAEEAQIVTDAATHQAEQDASVAAATQKATDKTNGNQKLLDLGLTQAEVDAITGQ